MQLNNSRLEAAICLILDRGSGYIETASYFNGQQVMVDFPVRMGGGEMAGEWVTLLR